MQEIRNVKVNGQDVPVLISDEREALLAAKAAGRALVGLGETDPGLAGYAVLHAEDADEEFLERVARRHLGLPWRICETKRLRIREIFKDDFDEIWQQRIGRGFGSVEELEAYTEHQYAFYGFGFWAVTEKESGELVGVAGLTVPGGEEPGGALSGKEPGGVLSGGETGRPLSGREPDRALYGRASGSALRKVLSRVFSKEGDELELGYHIFPAFRRRGYARESCLAIMDYGRRELGAGRYVVRISAANAASLALAESLGFAECGNYPDMGIVGVAKDTVY